jgi:hypothetical protein
VEISETEQTTELGILVRNEHRLQRQPRLPALSLMTERFEVVALCPICSLPELSNPVDDLLPLPIVNRYFETRLARGRPDKRDCQVAAYIRLRLWLLRCFQDFEKLSGLGKASRSWRRSALRSSRCAVLRSLCCAGRGGLNGC